MIRRAVGLLGLALQAVAGARAPRRAARYELLAALAKRWDFRLYQANVTWFRDQGFARVLRDFAGPGGHTPKRYNLYHLARSVAHLEGDTVECGVATGVTSYLLCHATSRPGRFHHGFDSFAGLSDPAPQDTPPDDVIPFPDRAYAADVDSVREKLARFEGARLYKGWIPERFHEVGERRFIFCHVDVDLYRPTLDSLSFFYERIVPGGMIVCDDYGWTGTPGARQAFDEFLADQPEEIVKMASGNAFLIKR